MHTVTLMFCTSDRWFLIVLLFATTTVGMVAAMWYHALWHRARRAHTHLQNVSLRDHLTDCLNRRYLQDMLQDTEVSRARRYKQNLTVIMCDIDHFKAVNDTRGHHAGDSLLRHFADLLKQHTRSNIDSIVRYGGDEFLIILPETTLAHGTALAERLRSTLNLQGISLGTGTQVQLSASFGVASVDFVEPMPDISLDYLIGVADELLYEAKRGGRNCVRFLKLPRKGQPLPAIPDPINPNP